MPARYDGFLEGPADAGAGQQGKLLTGFAYVGELGAGQLHPVPTVPGEFDHHIG